MTISEEKLKIGKKLRRSWFKGIALERKVKDLLGAEGYLAIRSPRSLGLFDVWAINKKHIRLIQLKYNTISNVEIERIRAYDSLPSNAIKEVWIYKNGDFEKMVITTSAFASLLGLFMEYCDRVLEEKSIEMYQKHLKDFKKFTIKEGIDPLKITKSQIRKYLTVLHENDFTAQQIRSFILSLRKFYKFLVKYEIVKENIFDTIKSPRIPKVLPNIITENDMIRILDSIKDPLLSAILETLYATGVTSSELSGINCEDVNLEKEVVTIRRFDGSERDVPLTKTAVTKINNYRSTTKKQFKGPLFINSKGTRIIRRVMSGILESCGSDSGLNVKINPTTIRQSLIVHLLDRGMDPVNLKNMMGFESLESIMQYLDLTTKYKKETIDKFLPTGSTADITPEDIIYSRLPGASTYEKNSLVPKRFQVQMRYGKRF